MDNLNDAYLDVLSNYSGSVDDRRKAYLMDYLNYVNTTSLNDLEWDVLQKLGYKNSLTDAWLAHLNGLGGITLSDKGRLLGSTFYGSSPSRLFLNNEVGVWYDPSDLTTLFQDSAGTTPVTAAGQPVGLMLDKSGRGNHATQATSAQRPTYGIHPYSGVRNVANGSAAYDNTTYWRTTTTENEIVSTKTVGSDTQGPYVDIRFTGNLTAVGRYTQAVFTTPSIPALAGDTYTLSATAQLVAGTPTLNGAFDLRIRQLNSAGNYLSQINSPQSVGSSPVDISITGAMVANTTQIVPVIQFYTQTVGNIDVTYRVRVMQLEKSATRTAYQANYSQYNITEAGVPSVHYIGFDGVDDNLFTASITPNTDKAQLFAGIRKLSDTNFPVIAEIGALANGSFALQGRAAGVAGYSIASKGTVSVQIAANASAAPVTSVVTGIGDISTPLASLRLNGSLINTSASTQGTGDFNSYPIYIGRRQTGVQPFLGNLYSLIFRFGSTLTAAQITNVENWVNSHTGAY